MSNSKKNAPQKQGVIEPVEAPKPEINENKDLVKMTKDGAAADVHVNEVESYRLGGYTEAK